MHREAPAPRWLAGEPLFRLMWDGGVQRVGQPHEEGTGAARIEISPVQMRRLLQELSADAISALMLVIEHAYRPGQPTVVHGWSARWLQERGFGKSAATRAAKELVDGGYIRTETPPGTVGSRGKQWGVVPGGLLESIDDASVGTPTSRGRGAAARALRTASPVLSTAPPGIGGDAFGGASAADTGGESLLPGAVSRIPGNGTKTPVDDADPGFAAPVPSLPGNRETDPASPQVRALAQVPGKGASTAPTRRLVGGKEVKTFTPSTEPVPQAVLGSFLAQPALRTRLNRHWEMAVARVSGALLPQAHRCSRLLTFLGEEDSARAPHPETRMAQMLVDLLRADGVEAYEAAQDLEAVLRSRQVRFRSRAPQDLIAAVIATMVVSLDVTEVKAWGGFFATGLKTDHAWFPSPTLMGVLAVLSDMLDADTPSTAGAGAGEDGHERAAREVAVPLHSEQTPAEGSGRPEVASPAAAQAHAPVEDVGPVANRWADLRPSVATARATGPGEHGAAAASSGGSRSAHVEEVAAAQGHSASYLRSLRAAARGTAFEDDESFERLLRNPQRQVWVLERHEQRLAAGGA